MPMVMIHPFPAPPDPLDICCPLCKSNRLAKFVTQQPRRNKRKIAAEEK